MNLLLLALLGCKEPEQFTVGGRTATLNFTLTNPTSCAQCDPWRDVDTLVVRVLAGKDVVTEATFQRDAPIELADLPGFGVVRVELEGLAAGQVRSAGRSPEVALGPDVVADVPMTFLPVNRMLPLAAAMGTPRSRHVAVPLVDGRVLIAGGEDPGRTRVYPTAELFDPREGTFAAVEGALPAGVASPTVLRLEDGDVMLVGGLARTRSGAVSVPAVTLVDHVTGAISAVADLNVAREGACAARFRDKQAIVLGGADGDVADYLKPGDGDWSFDAVPMRDFDPSRVDACASLEDGSVLVLGESAATTGIWAPADGQDPGAAFTPVRDAQVGAARLARGATTLRTETGTWMLGGVDPTDATLMRDSAIYDEANARFVDGPALTAGRFRPQVVALPDGIAAVGCGWGDEAMTRSVDTVELVDLRGDDRLPSIATDRARPGCTLTALDDGSVLIAGGFGASSGNGATAALMLPWVAR